MKHPENKQPDIMYISVWFIIPLCGLLLASIVPILKCYNAKIDLNYSFGIVLLAICFISVNFLFMLVVNYALIYIWEYKALVQYLRERNLESFIQEAKKIRRLNPKYKTNKV